MATGEITTLPSTPEDGGSGSFTPGAFKDPKRLYCKNGGFFLRIKSDGGVDGIREKSDPHIKLQLQATSVGEVVVKGVCANRYLAMNRDGRLFGVQVVTKRGSYVLLTAPEEEEEGKRATFFSGCSVCPPGTGLLK
ncbi:fibroblast growth factor 2 [Anarrhichthys ocellatus]|uniref:fibroblast growth factor 2 n=1 Tax=Anarrhichthys ocellatus TaxID=433405 RepID=UPI0012EDBF5B|nr:fibroblast growth factor 2 [Anarrhichthys ocellatus]